MKIKLLFVIAFFAFTAHANVKSVSATIYESPINGKTVSFSEFLDVLTSKNTSIDTNKYHFYIFRNIKVVFDEVKDKKEMDNRYLNGGDWKSVIYNVSIENCDFGNIFWMMIRKIRFEKSFYFKVCKTLQIKFKECQFNGQVRIFDNQIGFLEFKDCQVNEGMYVVRNNISENIHFIDSKITIDESIPDFKRIDHEKKLFCLINKATPMNLELTNCQVELPKHLMNNRQYDFALQDALFSNIKVRNTTFNCNIDLSGGSVSNELLLENSTLNGTLTIDALGVNSLNTRVNWSTIAGNKLSIRDDNGNVITGANLPARIGESTYNNLISSYATIYYAFKSQGNRVSANAAYIEWKNIETQYLRQKYKIERTSEVYFNYLANVFLREFCDYGTNPLKSIYLSGWVLFFFGFLYFLFPYQIKSYHDKADNMFDYLLIYAHYLSSDNSLQDTFRLIRKIKLKQSAVERFVRIVESQKENLPVFFFWLSKPFIFGTMAKDIVFYKFHSFVDIYPSRWSQLKLIQKLVAYAVFGFICSIIILYFVFIRLIDALALSLNVFSTLGFGEIPSYGIIRYFTVIEGFIGWFLLSIFSVSLISQVIQ